MVYDSFVLGYECVVTIVITHDARMSIDFEIMVLWVKLRGYQIFAIQIISRQTLFLFASFVASLIVRGRVLFLTVFLVL